MSERWDDEHIIAESEALGAYFDSHEMSLEVAKLLRKMRNAADRRIEELERINTGLLQLNERNVNDAVIRIRAGDTAFALVLLMNDGIAARDARIAELEAAIPVAIYRTLKYALDELAYLDADTPSTVAAKAWLKEAGSG